MDWSDEGFVLAARRQGESSTVVQLLTRAHGRHAGLLRGGAGAKGRALVEAGNRVSAHWRARLAEQLGHLKLELIRAHAPALIARPGPLAALVSATALLAACLPEREPHPAAFLALDALLTALEEAGWAAAYVRWELSLLTELGYGLDLACCAVTGATSDLAYVSPKSARAVSRAGAKGFEGRLLPLPAFLIEDGSPDAGALREGLGLTGHFLERLVFAPADRPLPPARMRLLARIGAA